MYLTIIKKGGVGQKPLSPEVFEISGITKDFCFMQKFFVDSSRAVCKLRMEWWVLLLREKGDMAS